MHPTEVDCSTLRQLEWLETDGLGGFAMGTVEGAGGGVRTRRYHGLLIAADPGDPAKRMMLVNGVEAWVQTPNGRFHLTSQHYAPDVLHPPAERIIESFTTDPWPRWMLQVGDGTRIEYETFMRGDGGAPVLVMRWRMCEPRRSDNVCLFVRPLISGRDYHALHRENAHFGFEPAMSNGALAWKPYAGAPEIVTRSNGSYRHEAVWYRNFLYAHERDRGFDCIEDLASPGVFTFDLGAEPEAVLMFAAGADGGQALRVGGTALACCEALQKVELRRRQGFEARLHVAADQYIVRRGEGKTIIAGYPWFADWGRDTFIAMRGLCLATGRLDDARTILLAWAATISQGMLPNRFPDSSSGSDGAEPEYNSVDASLWFIIAVHELLEIADRSGFAVSTSDRQTLLQSVQAILTSYFKGTRYGIRCDDDGLLAAGEPGQQLTWMDARVGWREITPRIGKPVEVQALWLNALWIGAAMQNPDRWRRAFEKGHHSFCQKFWNSQRGYLYDVIDDEHTAGKADPTFRPNQIFAVGGLPLPLLAGQQARAVVAQVERALWTPMGLRSLAPDDPRYSPKYEGPPEARDAAYHQGTVWPWLIGPFVEAWVRVQGGSGMIKRQARRRFIEPLTRHLSETGVGHISEIADGEPGAHGSHTPRGCPFQAWSLGELMRLEQIVLCESPPAPSINASSKARRAREVARPSV